MGSASEDSDKETGYHGHVVNQNDVDVGAHLLVGTVAPLDPEVALRIRYAHLLAIRSIDCSIEMF